MTDAELLTIIILAIAMMVIGSIAIVARSMRRESEELARAIREAYSRYYQYSSRHESESDSAVLEYGRRDSRIEARMEALRRIAGAARALDGAGEPIRCPSCGQPLVSLSDGVLYCPREEIAWRLSRVAVQTLDTPIDTTSTGTTSSSSKRRSSE